MLNIFKGVVIPKTLCKGNPEFSFMFLDVSTILRDVLTKEQFICCEEYFKVLFQKENLAQNLIEQSYFNEQRIYTDEGEKKYEEKIRNLVSTN